MAGKMPLTRSRKRSLEESNAETISDSEDESIPECAVCLQECSHPCRLPCGHIFCFLCVKGVSLNIPNCPMCRANIPRGYFDNPDILSVPKKNPAPSAEGYKWYYEGRHGGWWEYDARTSADLEEALKAQERSIQVLIAGTVYTIDLIDMVQTKPDGRSSRRIKRSLQPIPTKGIAGIRKHRRLPQPPLVLVPVVERFVSDLDDDDDDEFSFGPEFEDDDDYGDDPVMLSSESEPEIYDDAEPDIDDDPDVSVDDEPEVNSDSEPEIISDDEPESNDEIYIDSESDAGCSDYGPDDDDDVSDDYFGDDFDDCDDFF